jgi:hypothetical protein
MTRLPDADILERLRAYAGEFLALARSPSPEREALLNGSGGRHGLNHIVELVQMLPPGADTGEFKIRE